MSVQTAETPAPLIKPKTSRDGWIMCAYLVIVGLYLLAALVFPLYTMVSKSFDDYLNSMDKVLGYLTVKHVENKVCVGTGRPHRAAPFSVLSSSI